jgi:hypothetical protein
VGRDQPASLPAIWNVPYLRHPHFTGRDTLLDALRGAWTSAQSVALTQVVRGLGGIGKTQLALEYAYRYGVTYRLVWWVRAEEPETLATDYAALAAHLDGLQHTAHDQPATIAAVRQWLEHHARWLLILDNAPAPAAVQAYMPRTLHGHILITSRHFGWGGTAQVLTVPLLPRAEAVTLLLAVTQQADSETAGTIAETLGDLPLALAQAGIRGRRVTIWPRRRRDIRAVPRPLCFAACRGRSISFPSASPAAGSRGGHLYGYSASQL